MLLLMMLATTRTAFRSFLPPPLHKRLVTLHTENPLRRPGIFEVLDFLLAISAFEAGRAKGLVAREDGQVLNLVTTCAAAVGTVVADE